MGLKSVTLLVSKTFPKNFNNLQIIFSSNLNKNHCTNPDLLKTSLAFHDRGRYHIEISPLISSANQWTGFDMITASVMKELIENFDFSALIVNVILVFCAMNSF